MDLLDFAKQFAIFGETSVIIGSEEINPYHWILVEPNGSHRNVFVDTEKLDKENAFVVLGDADY